MAGDLGTPGSSRGSGAARPAPAGTAGLPALDLGAIDSAGPGAAPAPGVEGAAAAGLAPEWQRLRLFGGGALGMLVAVLMVALGWQTWHGRAPVAVEVRSLGSGSGAEIRVQVAGAVASPGVYRLRQGDRVEDAVTAAGGLTADADGARLNLAQRVRDEQRLDVPFASLPRSVGTVAPPAAGSAAASAGEGDSSGDGGAGGTEPAMPAAPAPAAAATQPARPSASPPPATPRAVSAARATSTPRTAAPAAPTARPDGKVDVNAATQAQLEQLPGIGEVSARRIVEYRSTRGPIRSVDDLRQAGLTEAVIRRAADSLYFG